MGTKITDERGQSRLRWLDKNIGIPICFMLGLTKSGKHQQSAQVNRIGIMILGAIGDALLASAVVDSLRKSYNNATLVLILSEGNKQVADLIEGYDEVSCIKIKRPDLAISALRSLNLDLLVDTSQWPRISAAVSFFSRAQCTVGFKTSGQRRHYVYDILCEHSSQVHELDNFRRLAEAAGGEKCGEPVLQRPTLPSDIPNLPKTRYVVFHPWASGFKHYLREWPVERWKELAHVLIEDGFHIVISGSPADVEASEQMVRQIGHPQEISIFAGKLSLVDLRDLLIQSDAVISVNTGVMHLSALLGALTVSLNGPTNAIRWGGVGNKAVNVNVPLEQGGGFLNLGFEYPERDMTIMDKITVKEVMEALRMQGLIS